eukprot:72629-Chlamydomonas_euryale.AAC.4
MGCLVDLCRWLSRSAHLSPERRAGLQAQQSEEHWPGKRPPRPLAKHPLAAVRVSPSLSLAPPSLRQWARRAGVLVALLARFGWASAATRFALQCMPAAHTHTRRKCGRQQDPSLFLPCLLCFTPQPSLGPRPPRL